MAIIPPVDIFWPWGSGSRVKWLELVGFASPMSPYAPLNGYPTPNIGDHDAGAPVPGDEWHTPDTDDEFDKFAYEQGLVLWVHQPSDSPSTTLTFYDYRGGPEGQNTDPDFTIEQSGDGSVSHAPGDEPRNVFIPFLGVDMGRFNHNGYVEFAFSDMSVVKFRLLRFTV